MFSKPSPSVVVGPAVVLAVVGSEVVGGSVVAADSDTIVVGASVSTSVVVAAAGVVGSAVVGSAVVGVSVVSSVVSVSCTVVPSISVADTSAVGLGWPVYTLLLSSGPVPDTDTSVSLVTLASDVGTSVGSVVADVGSSVVDSGSSVVTASVAPANPAEMPVAVDDSGSSVVGNSIGNVVSKTSCVVGGPGRTGTVTEAQRHGGRLNLRRRIMRVNRDWRR